MLRWNRPIGQVINGHVTDMIGPIPGANFTSQIVKSKISPGRIPLNLNGLFSTFLARYVYSLKLSRIYSMGEKTEGKVSIKVLKNSARRNFTLNI